MESFKNVQLRDGSYDGGRDIEADYVSVIPDGITERRERWWFECKKYSKGISFDKISKNIMQADLNKIDTFVVMSNMHLTPSCQTEIANTKKKC